MFKKFQHKQWELWTPKKIEKSHDHHHNKKISCTEKKSNDYNKKVNDNFTNQTKKKLIDTKKNPIELNKKKSTEFENRQKQTYDLYLKKKQQNQEKIELLLRNLQRSLVELDSEINSKILNIIIKITNKILGEKPKLSTSCLLKKIKKIVDLKLQENQFLQFYVHKNELKLIQKYFKEIIKKYKWNFSVGENLLPGECKIDCKHNQFYISATKSWKVLRKNLLLKEKK